MILSCRGRIRITLYSSVFPTEILEEMENLDFTLFNSEEGSYQMMVPRLLHVVHTSLVRGREWESLANSLFDLQREGLSYMEYVMVTSAFKSGAVDTVFIHSATSLNSSYLDILSKDKTLEVSWQIFLISVINYRKGIKLILVIKRINFISWA